MTRMFFSNSILSTLLFLILFNSVVSQKEDRHDVHDNSKQRNSKPRHRRRNLPLGAYGPADVSDPFITSAVEFTKEALVLQKPYKDFIPLLQREDVPPSTTSGDTSWNLSVVKAETQVVAGMNIRMTLQILIDDACVAAFDVEIYNHFGEMTVTNWGSEQSCEDVLMPADVVESLILEGTTIDIAEGIPIVGETSFSQTQEEDSSQEWNETDVFEIEEGHDDDATEEDNS